jgi:hypothetical protein
LETLARDEQLLTNLWNRHSPDPTTPVLWLDGQIGAGQSGSPVVTTEGKVVAVADGGLNPIYSIQWAIPLSAQIPWKKASAGLPSLRRLAAMDIRLLFSSFSAGTQNTSPRDSRSFALNISRIKQLKKLKITFTATDESTGLGDSREEAKQDAIKTAKHFVQYRKGPRDSDWERDYGKGPFFNRDLTIQELDGITWADAERYILPQYVENWPESLKSFSPGRAGAMIQYARGQYETRVYGGKLVVNCYQPVFSNTEQVKFTLAEIGKIAAEARKLSVRAEVVDFGVWHGDYEVDPESGRITFSRQ